MGQSVVINPSGDPSGDFHPAVASLEAVDSGAISKKSSICVCHFCGRLCRNAQALGGHMNVHRRERAVAKQLMELRNQGEVENVKGTSTTAATTGVVVASAASRIPPPAGEVKQEHLGEEVVTHGGSSASSSSPPSPRSIAIASSLVHPWRSFHRLPSKSRKSREVVDLELRLGFSPGRFL